MALFNLLPAGNLTTPSRLPVPSKRRHIASSASFHLPQSNTSNFSSSHTERNWVSRFQSTTLNLALSGTLALCLFSTGVELAEAKVGVNKPELLPKEFTPVIDVAGFLSDGQEKRIAQEIADINNLTLKRTQDSS